MEYVILSLIITQIIVESLPISSSGHVALVGLLANRFFGIQNAVLPDFLDNLLHGTALLAILIVFFKDWFVPVKKLIQCCFQFAFNTKPLSFSQKKLLKIFMKIAELVIVADLITSVLYFAIKIGFKDYFTNSSQNFLLLGFIITMLLLLSLRFIQRSNLGPQISGNQSLNFKKAVILGLVQGCAVLPGISRFASTYVAGCWLNLSPRRAFQLSFLIHLPLIIAAFLFLGVKDIFKRPEVFQDFNKSGLFLPSLFLILAAATIAIFTLKLCYRLAVKNKLWWFGIYMLIPIITLIAIIF